MAVANPNDTSMADSGRAISVTYASCRRTGNSGGEEVIVTCERCGLINCRAYLLRDVLTASR